MAKAPLHSTGHASHLTALFLAHISSNMLARHALPAGRLTGLGATRGFTMACLQAMRPFLTALAVLLATGSGAAAEAPPLVDAARHADAAAVRALLDGGADAAAAAVDGTTALHWASYRDAADAAELLLGAGADANAATDLGVTPLWLACENGNAAMVGRLLRAGADPNRALLAGETPVMVAARGGYPEVVELLADAGADLNARSARGQTALMWAAGQRRNGAVAALLAHGADAHARSDVWSQVMAVPPHARPENSREIPHGGNTALMFAARAGDAASVQLLVAAGADVDAADAWGVSALALAAHAGHRGVAEALLAAGADASAAGAGFAPLHAAVMHRDQRLVAALLEQGADPDARVRNWTPTRRASRDYHFPPALVGATPFWLAARYREPGIMRLLARHGADPLFVHRVDYLPSRSSKRRHEARTALLAATDVGGGRMARGWVPPASDDIEARMLATVKLALQLGVDAGAADLDGNTALDAAQSGGFESVARFLTEHGARNP